MGKSKEAWSSLQEEELENNPVERYEEEESATPMTNEQILKKAIEKAIKNKYKPDMLWKLKDGYKGADETNINKWNLDEYYKFLIDWKLYKVLIFSHDFAKAFWGEASFETINSEYPNTKVWQHHLMLMVLKEDPILYLKQFLYES